MAPAPDFEAIGGDLISTDLAAEPTGDTFAAPTEEVHVTPPVVHAPIDAIASTGPANFQLSSINTFHNIGPGDLTDKIVGLGKGLSGTGNGKVGGTMMRFFNTMSQAQSVVMCMDVSSSMVGSPKSPKTYALLEKEVAKLIRGLPDNAYFGIVVFSREARGFHNRLVRASNEDKEKAVNWVKKMSPEVANDAKAEEDERQFHHGTRADLGLEQAFALQPDVIFFASDGEPSGKTPPEILAQVMAAQKERAKPSVVNVVAYVADGGQSFMRDLATQNQGAFREITLADVK
jgi:ABC-type arginine transport system ATPase subunit